MSDTDGPCEPHDHSSRSGRSGRSSRGARTGRRAALTADHARSELCATYYRPLLKLAALLTCDPGVAAAVVANVLVAIPDSVAADCTSDQCLRYLQLQVLVRCRREGRYRRRPGGRGKRAASGFAGLPVVMAMQDLPQSAREAIVLTHYLSLPAGQAAAVAGISEALLTANLAIGLRALDDHFTGLSPDS